MGEIIHMGEYLERKGLEIDKSHAPRRLAEIAIEISILEAEREHLTNLYPPEGDGE